MRRDLDWPDCVNVRDLGGLPTGDGRVTAFRAVVRADDVARLTEDGWAEARAYGIRTILDLRSRGERVGAPPAPAGLDGASISLFDDFDGDPAYRADIARRVTGVPAAEAYRLLYAEALERNAVEFAAACRVVARARPGGVLVHCAGGKDRTGVLAALLLRLAGVPVRAVAGDYERSEARLGVVDSAPAGVIEEVIARVEGRHGDVAGYFGAAGVSPADIDAARARLGGPHALASLVDRIVQTVAARPAPGSMQTKVVAVDGPGAAGKSTFAAHLAAAFEGAAVVHTDDFASWDEPVDWWPRLLREVLEPLARNAPTLRFERSAWEPGATPSPVELRVTPVVVLEGVTASREAFRPYLTYAIWIAAPDEVRLRRGLERDGAAMRTQWEAWMRAEDDYRARERPDERADLVLDGGGDLWTCPS